jgi:hypothetical protein
VFIYRQQSEGHGCDGCGSYKAGHTALLYPMFLYITNSTKTYNVVFHLLIWLMDQKNVGSVGKIREKKKFSSKIVV